VRVLTDRSYRPGKHEVVWDGLDARGREVAAGVYFYAMEAGAVRNARKMVLIK